MPNAYTSLGTLKSTGTLGITGTDYDTQLLRIAEESSRLIDRYTDRFYYVYEGTMYQDGGASRLILDFDLQSITTLYADTDGDGTYETTFNLTSTPMDAYLYPQNISPKTRLEINPWGAVGHFAAGIRNGIKIVGVFGYGADWPAPYYHAANSVVTTILTSTDVTVDVTASTSSEFSAGVTLRIGSEQTYIHSAPIGALTSTCPITRAVNGTTAAGASTGTAINICDYPQAITQAAVIQTIRSWKRRESGYVNTIIDTGMGNIQVFKGLDSDIREIISQYRRLRIQRYI